MTGELGAVGMLGGLILMKSTLIKKKGRCFRYGKNSIFCHPDDYKQIQRGNAVGERRLKRMRITHEIPDIFQCQRPPLTVKFLEHDKFEARYLSFYDVEQF